ncbi:MAG: helix-turn-helix domain-containing protein [Janthinobacterium lividum]
MSVSPSTRPPGRPRSIDPRRIAAVALELFWLHGFEAVTLDQVADAAGVSRSTLRRSFPTKTDLLWDRLDEDNTALGAALEAAACEQDTMRVVCREVPRMLRYRADELDVLRRQTLLIAGRERSDGAIPSRLDTTYVLLASFFEARWGSARRDVAEIAASTVTVASWRAMVQWARSSDATPEHHQVVALTTLARGFDAVPALRPPGARSER